MRPDSVKKTDLVVPIAYRAPFAVGLPAWRDARPAGETILDMVMSVPDLPTDFLARGIVCINGEVVPRQLWAGLRPKPNSPDRPMAVTLHMPAGRGGGSSGGGGGGKSVIGLVAAFALLVVVSLVSGGTLAPVLGAAFTKGAIGAVVLSAAIGIGGALAIAALTPPPSLSNIGIASGTAAQDDTNTDQKQPASATGNVIAPGGSIPRVVGTRKVFPPLGGEPIVELVGDDEFVEAFFPLNGPHAITDPRVNDVSVTEAEDVEYEVREGFEGDAAMTLCTRQGRTIAPQLQLSVQRVNSNTQNLLAHPLDPEQDLPVWHGVASRTSPDEIWLHFLLPNGISVNGSTSTDVAIPLRIRFRKRGDTDWIQLPEIHLSDSTLQQRRRAVLLQWRTRGDVIEPVPTHSGFYYANTSVPGQSTLPATNAWVADSYFVKSSGTVAYLNNGTEASTKVRNMCLFDNRVEVYLDEDTFEKGAYEIEVKRGTAYLVSSFTASSYAYSGSVQDFFAYTSTTAPAIPMSRSNLADVLVLTRVVSIWNEYPVLKDGKLALLAMRARNRDLNQVSVVASGYVRDWDGSGWNTWTTTSNPAPHYADILCGAQNIDPLPRDIRDDTGLVAWRTLCASNGWRCDAIIDDFRTQDALTLLASCGYAKPYNCEIYGVVVDKDTSGDTPTQIFSRRNAANFRFERAFARVPEGFIVNYVDKDQNYEAGQVIIYQRDRSLATTGLLETISYDGLVERNAVIARAQFDLDQANLRSTFYYMDTDVQNIVSRKGDLIGVQHDIITSRCGDGVLKSKTVVAGNITALTLDSTIPVTNEPDVHAVADFHAVEDVHDLGITTGIAVRRKDGTVSTHAISNGTGETSEVVLATPVADTGNILGLDQSENTYGSLVVAGELGTEFLRLKVLGINPSKDLGATLAFVDEAPELERLAA